MSASVPDAASIRGYGISITRPLYLSHPASLAHDTGVHPERAARITAIERELAGNQWLGFERVEAPAIARELLERVHTPGHVAAIERLCALGGGAIDIDTVVSQGSWEAALHSAGAAVALVDALLAQAARGGFAVTRPPGHHAERQRAMGFCLFNNVALAASHALWQHGLERVLIVDWDVHHGNGTNDLFADSAAVLYCSIHQSPLYPGTGAANDTGSGSGAGYTVNLPVPAGSGDAVFCSLVEHVIVPLARRYEPQLLLISAGFDAHAADPLADCAVTTDGYGAMTGSLRRLSDELGVALGAVLEGGYALDALAHSVAATMAVLAAPEPPPAIALAEHPLALAARERLGEVTSSPGA
jgi:acetoin utilization deacetylase AcuC-like enzyme